jgi:hypothetical protein
MSQLLGLKVITEDPTKSSVPTLFSNHVAVARAGTEVQFEFVAMDINVLAIKMAEYQSVEAPSGPIEIAGKTVSKIVVPLYVFMQLEQHLQTIFSAVKQDYAFNEVSANERRAIS